MAVDFVCTPTEPVVQTKAGLLRGYKLGSTYHFLGVRYAEAKRWQMPEEVTPWEGVKDATGYGYACPLMFKDRPDGDLFVPHRFWPQSEDCQYLNVWTQTLDENAKKPVMVWIHGGAYMAGSSVEMVAYDGVNMSVYGDCVVVSMNHRLNCLGYFDVSAFGEKYWNSGNVGNADLVVCLQWVKDNIARFGGDPENVTIFGQSGGGRKVGALLQIPAAEGLFQKGIIESGTVKETLNPPDAALSKEIAEEVMKELGITDFEVLANETPYEDLAKTLSLVMPRFKDRGVSGFFAFAPHKNDWYLGDIRDGNPMAEFSKKIPVVIGTVFAESGAFSAPVLPKYDMPENEQEAVVKEKLGDKADTLIPLFKAAYPEKPLLDVLAVDGSRRWGTLDYLKNRAPVEDAPVYSYMFAFDFPVNYGTPAWHCSEIPFAFHNTDKVAVCNVPGVSDQLEEAVFGAWMNFARTGDPSTDRFTWTPFTMEKKDTLVFDKEITVRTDYDTALVETLINDKIF